jgi:hypothetical protein
MTSSEPSETLNLERDLPTSPADVAALRRAMAAAALDLEGYLRFLAQLPVPTAAALRARRAPRGELPFEILL